MNFLDIPTEIGIEIISYLDLVSTNNLYKCCNGIKRFFAPRHLKKVVFSRTSISRKIFHQDLFVNLGGYVRELDLSGLPNFSAATFKRYCLQLSNIESLDVTFTQIYLGDLLDFCPKNLKELAINFFERTCIGEDIWDMCIDIFQAKSFTKIHFIVFEIGDSDTPLLFLKTVPHIDSIRVTVAGIHMIHKDGNDYMTDEEPEEPGPLRGFQLTEVNFSEFSFILRECLNEYRRLPLEYLRGIMGLNLEQLEFIFIMYKQYDETILIHVSPEFGSLFSARCSHVRVEVSPHLPDDLIVRGNCIFHAWNKSLENKFNDEFYKRLQEQLRDYFPTYVCLCMNRNIITPVTNACVSEWFCIDSCNQLETKLDYLPAKVTLTDFCRKDGAVRQINSPISLLSGSETLKNITFLRLINININQDFFAVLFRECSKLNTLDIHVKRQRPVFRIYTSSLAAAIQNAQSLKNVKLTLEDVEVEYDLLFATLSQCLTLENIHVQCYYCVPGVNDVNVRSILTLIENCKDLYSLFIMDYPLDRNLITSLRVLREHTRSLGRENLTIKILELSIYDKGCNPFEDVFNPSPLHILN